MRWDYWGRDQDKAVAKEEETERVCCNGAEISLQIFLFEDSNNLETVFECPFSSYLRPKYNYAFIRRLQTAECGLAKAFKPAELICSTT